MIVLASVAMFFTSVVMVGHLVVVGWRSRRHQEAPPAYAVSEIWQIAGTVVLTLVWSYRLVHHRFPRYEVPALYLYTMAPAAAAWAAAVWLPWKKTPEAERPDNRSFFGHGIGFVLAVCIGAGMPES